MEPEKKGKKNLIIGFIVLVLGIALIAYGTVDLMGKSKKKDDNTPNADSNNMDESSITVTEDDVKTWLTDNEIIMGYFTDYNFNFDLGIATETDISDVFGWYFINNSDDKEDLDNSAYNYRYTISKDKAQLFVENYIGVPIDMVDVSLITFNKDMFNFTSDDSNFYVDVKESDLEKVQTCVLKEVNISSDSQIEVIYDVAKDETCDPQSENCYFKERKITLRKNDNGFTILKSEDIVTNDDDTVAN